METKHATERKRQEPEMKQAIGPEQSEDATPDKKINASNSTDRGDVSTGKRKILNRIWTDFLQRPIYGIIGIGTLLIGIGTLLYGIAQFWSIDTKDTESGLITPEFIVRMAKIVQDKEPEEFSQVKQSMRRVEQDHNAPAIDKAIAAAYKLQSTGKTDDAIEKWRSIAGVYESTNINLAAAAWFTVAYLHCQKGEVKKALPVFEKAFILKGY